MNPVGGPNLKRNIIRASARRPSSWRGRFTYDPVDLTIILLLTIVGVGAFAFALFR